MSALHKAVLRGDAEDVRRLLASSPDPKRFVNENDERGYAPLFHAVNAAPPNVEVVRSLLEAGADPDFVRVQPIPALPTDWMADMEGEMAEMLKEWPSSPFEDAPTEYRESALKVALKSGSLEVVRLFRSHGADLGFHDAHNYTAVLEATYAGRKNLDVVRYLIGLGLDVRAVTSYGESAISVASHQGSFDLVADLIKAGADEEPLGWTALHRAAALGTEADVQGELRRRPDLRAYDRWGRTSLHLALSRGDEALVDLLIGGGADLDEKDEDGRSSLHFAVEGGHQALVRRLLERGCPVDEVDAALVAAVENGQHAIARILLEAGANPNPSRDYGPLLQDAPDRDMILLLLDHGGDPSGLDHEARRKLLGFAPRNEDGLDEISREEYLAARYAEEGRSNPQEIATPFRLAMIRSGWSAYWAREHFDDPAAFVCGGQEERPPGVWCFDRFGQSTTLLPDGRIVLVAGEHEDGYDPDFCIYNDVAVFEADGRIRLFGYPYSVFPPTDFHTATLVGDWIVIIGSLGYAGSRQTPIPVVRLSTRDFHIEPVSTHGVVPGRVYKHRASPIDDARIRIEGGTLISYREGQEEHTPNAEAFILDTITWTWSRA